MSSRPHEPDRTDRPGSRPAAAEPCSVDVAFADGRGRRFQLPERPVVLGRSADADVCVDDPSVSRRHAELAPGPLGWTIRDLGSRNRTRVNGRDIGDAATPVGPADRVEVGGVRLSVRGLPAAAIAAGVAAAGAVGGGAAGGGVPMRDDPGTAIVGLTDLAPPAVGAGHLTALLDLGRELLATPDPTDRLRALCRHLIDREHGGRYAAVLRVRPGRPDAAEPLCEAGPDAGGEPYVSRTVLRAAAARWEAVLAGNRPDVGPADFPVSVAASVLPVAVIACPLPTATFGTGTLVTVTLAVPVGYAGASAVTVTAVPDTFQNGFSAPVPTTAGPAFTVNVVPEPGSLAALAIAAGGLLLRRRARRA